MTYRKDNPSRGFTIVELLIVIAIIGILFGLVAVGVIPWISGQKSRNTKALLKKLDGELASQWSAAMAQARSTPIPPGVTNMAGGNEAIARAIWIKFQLKRDFPMSYAEALNPSGFDNRNPLPPGVINYITPSDLPPRPVFVKNLVLDATKTPPIVRVSNNPNSESAACLLLSLQQDRAGMKFDPDSALGPSAVQDSDGDGLKEIVDGWGVPILFIRWGTGNSDLDALSRANGLYDRDTEDQEHALMNANWNADGMTVPVPVAKFQQLFHPIRAGAARRSYYTIPTVVSAGPDNKMGLDWFMTPLSSDATDNLYSFKLR